MSLPADPDLGKLRRQARQLQRAVRAGDAAALELVSRLHPGDTADFPLSAAQLVVARGYGFASWPRLKHHLDVVRAHSWRPAGEDTFCSLACLTYGEDSPERWARAASLLADDPGLVLDDVWAAAAAADLDVVRRLVGADRSLARRRGGPNGWSPLFYLTYSRVGLGDPVGVARVLLEAGADPHEGYLWHGLPTPFTLLTGAFGGGEGTQPAHPDGPALARLFLAAGADPNDGQTLYNRMFRPADDHLELLFAFGLGTGDGGVWKARLGDALDSPTEMLCAQLRWAVTHGQLSRVKLLVEHGVDASAPLRGRRTAADLAALSGFPEIASYLGSAALDEADAVIAAAMAGRAPDASEAAVRRARRRRPGLLVWAASPESGAGVESIRVLLDLGWPVDAYGRGDAPIEQPWETALHQAAHHGDLELIGVLLAAGADRSLKDARFDGTPYDWARHGGHDDAAALLAPLEEESPAAERD